VKIEVLLTFVFGHILPIMRSLRWLDSLLQSVACSCHSQATRMLATIHIMVMWLMGNGQV